MNCPACTFHASLLIKRGLLPSGLAVYECGRCGTGFLEGACADDYWAAPAQAAIYEDAAVAAERARFFESILAELARLKAPGRLLDVGAGKGEFAVLAGRKGWRVSVVEPSSAATQGLEERGVDEVFNCTFEAFEAGGEYDCVALLDFIEHTGDPAAVMKKAARCLAPGGVLVALTPDGGALVRRAAAALARASIRLSGLAKYLYYPPHFSYVTARGFSRIAASSGLEVLAIRRAATPRRFLLAKLRAHYGKYRANSLFCAAVGALYPLAKVCLPNKLFAVARKAPR